MWKEGARLGSVHSLRNSKVRHTKITSPKRSSSASRGESNPPNDTERIIDIAERDFGCAPRNGGGTISNPASTLVQSKP